MSERFPSNGGRSIENNTESFGFPRVERGEDRLRGASATRSIDRMTQSGEGMFIAGADEVGPSEVGSSEPVPSRRRRANGAAAATDRSAEAERSLLVVLSRLGFGAGNVEHALPDLLQKTLDDPTSVGVQAAEAARLTQLWVDAVELEVVRVGELERAASQIEQMATSLFAAAGDGSTGEAVTERLMERSVSDLARTAESLGPRNAYLLARPTALGVLNCSHLRLSDSKPEPQGWRHLANALSRAVENGAGSTLGVALLEAARGDETREAAHLRDVVGGATADGAHALFRHFEEIAEERTSLERQVGLNAFGFDEAHAETATGRALLAIADNDGVLERYDRVAKRVRRTVDDLRTARLAAPGFTLEFGEGRLVELATAVVL